MPPALTHDEFSQHVNTRFQVQIDDGTTIEMELAEISELKVHPNQEEFAIVFRGPSNAFLQQGIRSVTHEQMGQFELFLVPIQQDTQGFYYEAVFNRVRE
jgi:hypothetical protein